jgi:hypothetical protein
MSSQFERTLTASAPVRAAALSRFAHFPS